MIETRLLGRFLPTSIPRQSQLIYRIPRSARLPTKILPRSFSSSPLPTKHRTKLWNQTNSWNAGHGRLINRRYLSDDLLSKQNPPKEPPSWKKLAGFGAVAILGGLVYIIVSPFLEEHFGNTEPHPSRFLPFTIVEREIVSSTCILLTIIPDTIVPKLRYSKEATWKKGTWSVEIKQPELQVARYYTPLPPTTDHFSDEGPLKLRFLIRKEEKGEVSSYLHNLPVGAKIHLRGPHEEYNIPDDVKNVVFIAGGTGITPAIQTAYTLLWARATTEKEKPRIHIIWANRRREDCIGGGNAYQSKSANTDTEVRTSEIVQMLQNLQQSFPKNLIVDYVVDEERTFIDEKKIIFITPWNKGTRIATVVESPKNVVMISGPEGFVSYFAGPKAWENGKEVQGPVGGVLGKLGFTNRNVWKQ